MDWIHDTGFQPAYRHDGSPFMVLTNGALVADLRDVTDPRAVVGWKAGCRCGWRSPSIYERTSFPSPTGAPPAAVTGEATGTGAWADWRWHLFAAVPALILADVVSISLPPRTDVLTHPMVAAVVDIVRGRGASWGAIAEAAGVTSREARLAWAPPPTQRTSPRSIPVRSVSGPRSRSAPATTSRTRPAAGGSGCGCAR